MGFLSGLKISRLITRKALSLIIGTAMLSLQIVQPQSPEPDPSPPPEIVHLKNTICARYPDKHQWIPVANEPRTGNLRPVTELFRRRFKALNASGRKTEVRRLKWRLKKLQRSCRTFADSGANINATATSAATAPQGEVTPALQPTDTPTPTPQNTPFLIATSLPDISIPQPPPGGFSFALIDACANRAVLGLGSEWSAQRNLIPLSYTVKANANAGIRSVRFSYGGISRIDNTPPFSLFGDSGTETVSDYLPGELPYGRTVIEVTGYSLPDGVGLPAATGLLTVYLQPNPVKPATVNLSQIATLYLPAQMVSVDTLKLNASGCLAVDGSNSDGNPVSFELIDEAQSWRPTVPDQTNDDSASYPDGYQKVAGSDTKILMTYQKDPFECGWNGLSFLTNGIPADIPSPFQGCVSIERGSNIPGSDNFILLGIANVYSEDSDPVASLYLARLQGNGKALWKARLPFTLQTTLNVQNITYIPQSATGSLNTEGTIGILLSIGDDPSGPLPPAPLLPGTNVVFADGNSGIVSGSQFFPANEEPLKVAGLGYDSYGILSVRPGPDGTQSITVRVVR